MQSSATVVRTDTMDYRPKSHDRSIALKSGGQCTFGPPLPESEGARTPTGSPPLQPTYIPVLRIKIQAYW